MLKFKFVKEKEKEREKGRKWENRNLTSHGRQSYIV